MNKSAPTIVLTGGGSGGHITPLLSLARELKSQSPDCEIIYIGFKGDNFDTFKESGHDFDFMAFIKAGKFRRYHGQGIAAGVLNPKTMLLNTRDFFRLPGSIIVSWRLLRKFRPDVVFSKGSFVAVPVGVAAKLQKIPIITHDSDTVPGLANRLVGRWAAIHATGMPTKYYNYPAHKTHYVGIPLDERVKKITPRLQAEAKSAINIPKESRVLLLSGGGNGSKNLNDLLVAIAPELLKTHLSLHIVHISGEKHEAEIRAAYKSLSGAEQARVIVKGYTTDFPIYAAAADLIITRSGATTLAELAVAGKACIVIPAPFLSGGHQLKNAEELTAHDAAVVMPDETSADELLAVVNNLLADDSRRFELGRNLFATAKPNASSKLASLILKTALK